MTIFLLIGLLGMVLVIGFKGRIIGIGNEDSFFVHRLKQVRWLQNHWFCGIFIFIMNAALFCFTHLVLFGLMFVMIPYVHLVIMLLAVIGSIFFWVVMNKVWQGTKRDRLKVAAIGSSFYLFLSILSLYRFVTLQPSYPGEDISMQGIGLLIYLIVTTVAFISCFVFTGFSKRIPNKQG